MGDATSQRRDRPRALSDRWAGADYWEVQERSRPTLDAILAALASWSRRHRRRRPG